MLDHPEQAQGVVAVSGQLHHCVNHVFQGARSGQAAVLGEVADQHDGQASGLGLHNKAVGAGSDLTEGSRSAFVGGQVDSLDRVHDEEGRLEAVKLGHDPLHGPIIAQPQVVVDSAQAPGPEPDLGGRLLGTYQEDPTTGLSPGSGQLQYQGGLAHSGLTP